MPLSRAAFYLAAIFQSNGSSLHIVSPRRDESFADHARFE
jgi:hypothetical protein